MKSYVWMNTRRYYKSAWFNFKKYLIKKKNLPICPNRPVQLEKTHISVIKKAMKNFKKEIKVPSKYYRLAHKTIFPDIQTSS